jgi:hypothetical protein
MIELGFSSLPNYTSNYNNEWMTTKMCLNAKKCTECKVKHKGKVNTKLKACMR